MKIVITQNITLDGRIEMLDDWFDPAIETPDLTEETRRQTEGEEVLLLGRQTFTDFRGYWPHQSGETADMVNGAAKGVITSTLTDPEWDTATILGDDPVAVARELREQPGGHVCVTGSIQVSHALTRADLVDEYRLFVYPAWQGRGRSLFPEGEAPPQLEQVRHAAFSGGVTFLALRPSARA